MSSNHCQHVFLLNISSPILPTSYLFSLRSSFLSSELFYVRQHMPVPELDGSRHRVQVIIKNGGVRTKEFSLTQLHMFPQATVRAALMCAGNRRSEMNEVGFVIVSGSVYHLVRKMS